MANVENKPAESSVPDDLFVTDEVHERKVELSDGKTHKLYFKELSAVDFRRLTEAQQSKDPDVRAKAVAAIISASVVEPDGRQAMTVERAAKLKPIPAGAIFRKILELNGAVNSAVEGSGDGEGN